MTQTMCRSLTYVPPASPRGSAHAARPRGGGGDGRGAGRGPRGSALPRRDRVGTHHPPPRKMSKKWLLGRSRPDKAANRPRAPRPAVLHPSAGSFRGLRPPAPPRARFGLAGHSAAQPLRSPRSHAARVRAGAASPRPRAGHCPGFLFVLVGVRGSAKAGAAALLSLSGDWSLRHPGRARCGN